MASISGSTMSAGSFISLVMSLERDPATAVAITERARVLMNNSEKFSDKFNFYLY